MVIARSTLGGPPPPRSEPSSVSPGSPTLLLLVIALSATALYFGREFFVPLALAILLSFALAPPVRWLRRVHMPRLPAVLLVVVVAFLLILSFAGVVAWQIADLANRLPRYQYNIENKIEVLRAGP